MRRLNRKKRILVTVLAAAALQAVTIGIMINVQPGTSRWILSNIFKPAAVLSWLAFGGLLLRNRYFRPLNVSDCSHSIFFFAKKWDASAGSVWHLAPAGEGDARALVGKSPELFLRITVDGVVETSPITGTLRRSHNDDDEGVAEDLATSQKDRAEHDMIVDLERNDLGRICMTGSVRVTEHARVTHLPTVHHLVSTVRGQLVQPRPSLRETLTRRLYYGRPQTSRHGDHRGA